jgi:hypothetical protein
MLAPVLAGVLWTGLLQGCYISPAEQDAIRRAWAERARECRRHELGFANGGCTGPEAHDSLTSAAKDHWLVICSCGWGRECVSEWRRKSVAHVVEV